MIDINATKDVLETMPETFSKVALECVESICQCKCEQKEPWAVVQRLQGKFDHIFSLGNANAQYQAIMAVGIQADSIPGFIPGAEAADMLMDAFGEIANQFCGLLMDSKEFTAAFGILTQSVPQYSVNQTFFPKVWGVEGKIWNGESWLYIGYAIRPTLFGAGR